VNRLTVTLDDLPPRPFPVAALTAATVTPLIQELLGHPAGRLTLAAEGLAAWPAAARQRFWELWGAARTRHAVTVRAGGKSHRRPEDLALSLVPPAAAGRPLDRWLAKLAAPALTLAAAAGERDQALGRLARGLRRRGVRGVDRPTLEALAAPAPPAAPAPGGGPNPTLLADAIVAEARRQAGLADDAAARAIHYHDGAFYVWDRVWRQVGADELRALVVRELQDRLGVERVTARLTGDVLLNLQGRAVVAAGAPLPFYLDDYGPPAVVRRRPILALANGLLDLAPLVDGGAARLGPPDPRWFATAALPYAYDPAARCPQFRRFLARVLERDPRTGAARWAAQEHAA
jgi:hypothetical protein